ncbi:MAG TPA: DUF932 domain-containing protein, partial [Mycobacterium sp.]|nr:DUF932 domain-containing protein [Mycobacterium sp.]
AGAKSTFGIRHTNGARVAIQEARTALGLAWRYMDAFETDAAALYAAPMELNEMRLRRPTRQSRRQDRQRHTHAGVASSRPAASSSCGRPPPPSPRSLVANFG